MRGVRRCLVILIASSWGVFALGGSASAQGLLYGADGAGGTGSSLYILDPATGAVVKTVGAIGFPVTGLALDPTTGTLYGAVGGKRGTNADPHRGFLIKMDRTTGAGTVIGDEVPDDEAAADITIAPDGTLYGWLEPTTDDLVTINKSTGAATVVGNSGLASTYGSGLASNASGVLYFAGEGEQGPLRTVDRNTGATTQVANLNGPNGGPGISSLAFDSAGTLFGSRLPSDSTPPNFTSDLLTINTSTAAITSKGPSIDRLDAIVFVPPRTVVLKKKLKSNGTKVRLFGQITDPGDPACLAGTDVQILRKKLGAAKAAKKKRMFKTFRTLKSDQSGNFSTKAKVNQSFKYRAFLPESNVCDDATSNVKKVKA